METLSLDPHPVAFVFALTVIYGGAASLAFCVGWIARQYLRRLRGHRLPVSHLTVASLVAACCSVALSALFIAVSLPSLTSTRAPYWSAVLAPIGLIGVVAGSAIIWSDGNRGRWGFQVAAPMTTPDSELRAIVRKRAPWILNHASGEMLEAAPKHFVSGETLPYLGRNVRMIVDTADVRSPNVRFDHWRFRVTVPKTLSGSERYEPICRAIVGMVSGPCCRAAAERC